MIQITVLILLVSIGCGAICRRIANHRRRDPVFWFVMGATFGPMALPFALLLEPGEE
jgi:hypothetical protein